MEYDYLRECLYDSAEPIDIEQVFDDFLDEIYDFKSVGLPFSHFNPSDVLKQFSPTTYRTMRNDYVNEKDFIEYDGEHWDKNDYEKAEELAEQLKLDDM